jgi:hypothetical protein
MTTPRRPYTSQNETHHTGMPSIDLLDRFKGKKNSGCFQCDVFTLSTECSLFQWVREEIDFGNRIFRREKSVKRGLKSYRQDYFILKH